MKRILLLILIHSFVILGNSSCQPKTIDSTNLTLIGYRESIPYFKAWAGNSLVKFDGEFELVREGNKNYYPLFINNGGEVWLNTANKQIVLEITKGGTLSKIELSEKPESIVSDENLESFYFVTENIADESTLKKLTLSNRNISTLNLKANGYLGVKEDSLYYFQYSNEYGYPNANLFQSPLSDLKNKSTIVEKAHLDYIVFSPDLEYLITYKKVENKYSVVIINLLNNKYAVLPETFFDEGMYPFFYMKENIVIFKEKSEIIKEYNLSELFPGSHK